MDRGYLVPVAGTAIRITTGSAAIPLGEESQRQITDGLGRGRWDAARRDLQRLTALAGENLSIEGADS